MITPEKTILSTVSSCDSWSDLNLFPPDSYQNNLERNIENQRTENEGECYGDGYYSGFKDTKQLLPDSSDVFGRWAFGVPPPIGGGGGICVYFLFTIYVYTYIYVRL